MGNDFPLTYMCTSSVMSAEYSIDPVTELTWNEHAWSP